METSEGKVSSVNRKSIESSPDFHKSKKTLDFSDSPHLKHDQNQTANQYLHSPHVLEKTTLSEISNLKNEIMGLTSVLKVCFFFF
jgi:hypothetical protein